MTHVTTINPATGRDLETYANWDADQLDLHLSRVAEVQPYWSALPLPGRTDLIQKIAAVLRKHKSELALLATREMGKCIAESAAEIEKCACACDFYATQGAEFLAPNPHPTEAQISRTLYRPLGTILGIMPWNFPFWQVFRFTVPTLLAGNTCLIKHAPNVRGCSEVIEALFREAGFPEAVCSQLPIDHDLIPGLISDPRVHGVSLTGSTRAGRIIAALAGKALKPSLLELGGSDPYLVLEDADPDSAAELCIKSRMINTGQSCIAAKRFIVHTALRKRFEAACLDRLSSYTPGNPEDPSTVLGPLARRDLMDTLHHQVSLSLRAGATLKMGGHPLAGEGFYYPPTLLCDPPPGSPARTEELFGPVGSILEVQDEDSAIHAANETVYGLGACVITQDVSRGQKIAEDRLHAGACFVNGLVKSDPRLPFGGIRDSGFGRELGAEGVRAFVNAKTVVVEG